MCVRAHMCTFKQLLKSLSYGLTSEYSRNFMGNTLNYARVTLILVPKQLALVENGMVNWWYVLF